jgi:hypothetical protein
MLSVEDVAEWTRHSLHMPEEVAELFRKNAVSGFDFPDLVDNGGELMETELGITKLLWKAKLYKGIIRRLMGMGKVPDPPSDISAVLETCADIRVRWSRSPSKGDGFPTHRYVVQRKGTLGPEVPTASSANTWITIFADNAVEHLDGNLQPSSTYYYRISAWNAVRIHFLFSSLGITGFYSDRPQRICICASSYQFKLPISTPIPIKWSNQDRIIRRELHFWYLR